EHHRLRPHLEHLHEMWRVLLTIGGYRGSERFRVAALVERLDLVLALALVELLGQRDEGVVELARHGVPSVGPGARLRVRGSAREKHRASDHEHRGAADEARHDVLLMRTSLVRAGL